MIRWPRWRLRTKLALLTGTACAAVMVANAYFTNSYVASRWMNVVKRAAESDADEIYVVLEDQMITGDRSALAKLVKQIGKAPGVAWVSLLDGRGRIRYSSEDAAVGTTLAPDSEEMRRLDAVPAGSAPKAQTLLREGCSVLRTLTPLPNGPSCVRCHPGERLTGALIIDNKMAGVQAAANSATVHVLIAATLAIFVLITALFLGVDRAVLRRLKALRAATQRLGGGDLTARAGDDQADEVGDLARDFNAMAKRLQAAVAGMAGERRQLEEIVNGIADGIVLLDPDLNVVTFNAACAERLPEGRTLRPGCSYRQLSSVAGFELAGPDSFPAERARETGLLEKRVLVALRDDVERYEEVYAQPLRAPDGSLGGVIEVWRDISQRKALEASLEQSERLAALGLIASSVAHEVGNPLAAIVTAIDALLDRIEDRSGSEAEEMRLYLGIARKQVFRCRTVTDRLLGFGRAPRAEVVRVDPGAAMREVLALILPQAAAQQVEVKTSIVPGAAVHAPDLALEQVFLNLLTNALRAMPEGGCLEALVTVQGAEVVVRVADTGCGMTEEVRRQLFQPFRSFRGERRGTGLGLFITDTLVKQCGGSVHVESAPGAGAAFTVRLPVAAAVRAEPLLAAGDA